MTRDGGDRYVPVTIGEAPSRRRPLRLRHRATHLLGSLHPADDRVIDVLQRFLGRLAVRHAARKLRYLGEISAAVFLDQGTNADLVILRFHSLSPVTA